MSEKGNIQSEAQKNVWKRDGYREKMRAIAKASWQNREIRDRRVAAIKAAYANPELRARMSVARKGISIKPVDVPKWVPSDLAEEYIYIARREGEEAAARQLRKMKKDMGWHQK